MSNLILNAVNLIRNQATGVVSDYSESDVYTCTMAAKDFYAWFVHEEHRTSCTFYYRSSGNALKKNRDSFRAHGAFQPANERYRPGFALSPKAGSEFETIRVATGVKRGPTPTTNYNGVKCNLCDIPRSLMMLL